MSRLLKTTALAAALGLAALTPAAAQAPGSTASTDGTSAAHRVIGPYAGHPKSFYDPWERLSKLEGRVSTLPPTEMAQAKQSIHRVRSFAEFQKSRHHGHLRDWDREHMEEMMNSIVKAYPALA